MSRKANLRCCASCEWIFKQSEHGDCPKCHFAHYGARYVYGNKAYKYLFTQIPWFDRKVDNYKCKLLDEIDKSLPSYYKANRENKRVQVDFLLGLNNLF